MPKIAQILILISSNRELLFDKTLVFVDNLKTYYKRDFNVAYLPQESPI